MLWYAFIISALLSAVTFAIDDNKKIETVERNFNYEEFKKDLEVISERAAKKTNEQLKDEIEKLKPLSSEEIEKLLPKKVGN